MTPAHSTNILTWPLSAQTPFDVQQDGGFPNPPKTDLQGGAIGGVARF